MTVNMPEKEKPLKHKGRSVVVEMYVDLFGVTCHAT
jgi:hypothetical protein